MRKKDACQQKLVSPCDGKRQHGSYPRGWDAWGSKSSTYHDTYAATKQSSRELGKESSANVHVVLGNAGKMTSMQSEQYQVLTRPAVSGVGTVLFPGG